MGQKISPAIFIFFFEEEISWKFVQFLDLWEFFQNQGLRLGSSDFHFEGLIDELFNMAQIFFSKKMKISGLIFLPHIKNNLLKLLYDKNRIYFETVHRRKFV